MVDQNNEPIQITWDFWFSPCGHIVSLTLEDACDLPFLTTSIDSKFCPRCKELDEKAAKEEVIRRMEMGLS